jgi:hypothetical protein
MIFSIYTDPTAGTPIWTQTISTVEVNQGIYSVVLGNGNPISPNVFVTDNAYLQVEVNGEVLSPRTKINSVGYALQAGGLSNGGVQAAFVSTNGNIGVGTVTPGAKLEVAGAIRMTSNGIGFTGFTGSVGNGLIYAQDASANSKVWLYTNGNSYLNGGNFGIGTTIPRATLNVSGNIRLEAANELRFYNMAINNWTAIDSPLLNGDTNPDFRVRTAAGILYMDRNGNVGLGRTSPTNKLEVADYNYGQTSIALFGHVTHKNWRITKSDHVSDALEFEVSNTAGGVDWSSKVSILADGKTGVGVLSPAAQLHVVGITDNAAFYVQAASSNAGAGNSLSNALYVDKRGNVGIGSVPPASKLYLGSGAITMYQMGKPQVVLNSAGTYWGTIQNDGNNTWSLGYNGSESVLGTPVLTWTSGSVGIGTTNPSGYKLRVNGSIRLGSDSVNAGTTKLYLDNPGSGGSVWALSSGVTNVSESGFGIYDGLTNRMVIDAAGNFGLGAVLPGGKMHIRDTGTGIDNTELLILASEAQNSVGDRAATDFITFRGAADIATAKIGFHHNRGMGPYGDISFWTQYSDGMAERMRVRGDRIGIGTSAPNYKLEVNGDINAIGNVKANGSNLTSDQRLKKNIQAMNAQLDKLSQLKGVSYEWRTDEFPSRNFENGKQLGVIAQEVEKIYPELVKEGKDGYKSVNYSGLLAPVIEAVKELKQQKDAEIQSLREQNAKLESRIKALEGK